ncbi:hypothetical protein IPZ70_03690 [Streptomyces polychromogenes]|nr:hypothetical protein [Streptomyces polychromogenes]
MVLRDVMLPLPMRPGWGPEMEWPYPGVAAALVAEFAGHPVAGRPFFAPETLTSDHGSVYKNHHLVQVARTLGVTVLPARAMRPTDEASCRRAFAGIQSLLLELLLGYRGVDVADRGADPEGDAVWTLSEMEHLIATWIVRIWQNRKLEQRAGLGSRRSAQPEHTVRRGSGPGRRATADSRPGALLPAAARVLR